MATLDGLTITPQNLVDRYVDFVHATATGSLTWNKETLPFAEFDANYFESGNRAINVTGANVDTAGNLVTGATITGTRTDTTTAGKAIATAAKFQLFEFNDAFTRAQFKNLVDPFLRDVQGRRGIFNFRTVCDETNNTPQVIDSNSFVADIFIQPARSINFIQLNFIATRTGISFDEVGG